MAAEGSLGTGALHRALVKRTEWERRLSGGPYEGRQSVKQYFSRPDKNGN